MEHDPGESRQLSERLDGWLLRAVASGASDLHLVSGHPPVFRLHGDLVELPEPILSADDTRSLVRQLCSDGQFARLGVEKSFDFSRVVLLDGAQHRFRVNVFHAGGQLAACLRIVPAEIPDFDWTGFPRDLAERLAFVRDGLVILTGVTGSGKTTSLALIVNLLNAAGNFRILTIEDPVEYIFPKAANSIVTQREVGTDVVSFADGLRHGLRQDPDVILVGEIRDRETAQMALSAAETGHLVFATLHTRDTKGAISRYADLFPQDVQSDIRSQLAMSLRAIVGQKLLPGVIRGEKQHLALEVLWNVHPIAYAIRQGKLESIDNYLLTRRDDGMISFGESIRRLLHEGRISRETSEQHIADPTVLGR